jgi:aldehyde:ferredoxin oxidoreductase
MYAMGMNYQAVFSSCGFCLFFLNIPSLPLVDLISAATGWEISIAELLKTGKRMQTLRQAFNIREGIQPQDIKLPSRLQRPALLGPMKDVPIDFETLKQEYYQEMGWNPKTGCPSEKCLIELGLGQLVDSQPSL